MTWPIIFEVGSIDSFGTNFKNIGFIFEFRRVTPSSYQNFENFRSELSVSWLLRVRDAKPFHRQAFNSIHDQVLFAAKILKGMVIQKKTKAGGILGPRFSKLSYGVILDLGCHISNMTYDTLRPELSWF